MVNHGRCFFITLFSAMSVFGAWAEPFKMFSPGIPFWRVFVSYYESYPADFLQGSSFNFGKCE
jgi:hypothetical protein